MGAGIEVEELVKSHGPIQALRGLVFEVEPGGVFDRCLEP